MQLQLETVLKSLQHNGYHVLENFFDKKEIKNLERNFDKFLFDGEKKDDFHANEPFIKSRNLFLRNDKNLYEKRFAKITKNDFILSLANEYLKKNYKPSKLMIYKSIGQKKDSFKKDKKFAFVPHTDETYFLKFFIYLTDVNEEHGPLNVVPGSHLKFKDVRHRWIKSNKDYLKRDKVNYNYENKMKSLNGKKGSLIIFDTDILHKAGVLKPNKVRKVIRFDFYSSDENYTTLKKKIYLKFKKLIKNFN